MVRHVEAWSRNVGWPSSVSTAAPAPTAASVPTTPYTRPRTPAERTLADTSTVRRGSASRVGVMVWCRNSEATASAPTSSGKT